MRWRLSSLLVLLLLGTVAVSARSRHYRDGERSDEDNQEEMSKDFPNELEEQADEDEASAQADDPCEAKDCGRWKECIVLETNEAQCVCQTKCPKKKKMICGSDGRYYQNHCELRKAACLSNSDIQVDHKGLCSKKDFSKKQLRKKPRVDSDLAWVEVSSSSSITTTTTPSSRSSTTTKDSLEVSAEEELEPESGSLEDQECCQQDYDFMKENLLLFYSKNGEVKRLGGSDSLMASMFGHYDTNADNYLQGEELWKASEDDKMSQLSQACILADMLLFDDVDKDGKLSVAEFYGAFNKLDSIQMVSLEKKLEVAVVQARVGDNVEIKCDVTGSPPPPIVWRRNGFDLNALNEEEIKVFVDGSLYLTNVQLVHSGNYTCHAQKNLNIVQTHVLHIHTLPEVHVIPRIQSRAPGELAEMECHVTGVPVPNVKWLKNDENLKMLADKYTIVGNGTALMVSKITYSDTGAYMCVASSPAGSSRDISSLVVQDEPAPTPPAEERRFFAFHDWGISVYDPDNCRLYHQVQSVDIIPGTQENLCAERGHPCSWGRAINVADRYVYVSQPTKGRVLVISRVQMVVVDVVVTDKFPVELYYVPHLDQLWVLCWRGPVDRGTKTIQIIRDASQKKKHHTVHPEPVDGHFDLVSSLFIPSTSDLGFPWKYGYVVHSGQNGLSKMDLRAMKYVKTIDFGNITCHPVGADFAALGGFIVVSCMDPDTRSANGQLVLDYLTDEVVSFKATLLGKPHVSPDSQYVVTLHSPSDKEKNSSNDITIVVQAVTDTGLHFLFDVRTTLRIADLTFFSSRTSHSYDLYASSSNKEDILLVNLQDGKVEMITGIGRAIDPRSSEWGNSRRPIASAGIFGTYMVTSANEAVFVINGKTRTVNCEIGNVVHPRLLVWVRSP